MTREEEIKKKVKELANYYAGETDYKESAAYSAAMAMADWVDQHPREGLVDIEKACKWLDENAYLHVVDGDSVTSLLEYFRKAMEE